jgi:hypothetical protein
MLIKEPFEKLEHIEFIKEKKHIVSITYDINYKKLNNDLRTFIKILKFHLKISLVKTKVTWYKFLVIINKGIKKHNDFWENLHFKKEGS